MLYTLRESVKEKLFLLYIYIRRVFVRRIDSALDDVSRDSSNQQGQTERQQRLSFYCIYVG